MLEVCPTIAAERGRIEVHPLAIGHRSDPARVVFDGRPGPALVASLVDLGNRFRLVVNEVEAVAPAEPMPRLPVGRVLWRPYPSLEASAEAWIYAGGAHHTVFSYGVTREQLEDFADLAGIECVVIGRGTTVADVRARLAWGEVAWNR
jgi:L-arabinose isomerase